MFNQKNLNNPQPTAATMVVIPQEEWLSLHEKLNRLAELVTNRNADDRISEWIESDAARKKLGISPKTWQTAASRLQEKDLLRKGDVQSGRYDISQFLRQRVRTEPC